MQAVLFTHGFCLLGLALFSLLPWAFEAVEGSPERLVFMATVVISLLAGGMLMLTNNQKRYQLTIPQAYLLTTTLWISMSVFAALPFFLTEDAYHLDFTDAVFESVSALTTTGATVYSGLDEAPHGILIWRSLLEWIGGVGIVVFSMTIFPLLRIGGMQLFKSESSDTSEKMVPRVHHITAIITIVYTMLTFVIFISYFIAGMTLFDAFNHAMTTISTGGFSTHDASFGYFTSPTLQWLGTLFMAAGGTPLLLYYSFFLARKFNKPLLAQAKAFWIGLAVVTLILAASVVQELDMGWMDAVRYAAFNVTSVVTTTGFATTDYTLWGPMAVIAFYFLTIAGGCTGSTSGGVKIFRFQVLAALLRKQFARLYTPRGVITARFAGKPLSDDDIRSVGVFFILFCFSFLLTSLGLLVTGLDFETSFSGAATALANVGPGLGDIIGPSGNFVPLSDTAKWILIIAMLAGRLEIMTMVVLFMPGFWADL